MVSECIMLWCVNVFWSLYKKTLIFKKTQKPEASLLIATGWKCLVTPSKEDRVTEVQFVLLVCKLPALTKYRQQFSDQ